MIKLSRGFSEGFSVDKEFPRSSAAADLPPSLLASLWIRCSLSAESHINSGLQGVGQKIGKSGVLPCRRY
ncbi:hypothetical protein EMIT048CA2_210020 [Pseudomonas chlororaphis]